MAKLKFKVDGIIGGKVVFKAGEEYEISNETGSVTRWLKRGAEIVEDSVPEAFAKEEVAVVNKAPKKENKKENKSSKQG